MIPVPGSPRKSRVHGNCPYYSRTISGTRLSEMGFSSRSGLVHSEQGPNGAAYQIVRLSILPIPSDLWIQHRSHRCFTTEEDSTLSEMDFEPQDDTRNLREAGQCT